MNKSHITLFSNKMTRLAWRKFVINTIILIGILTCCLILILPLRGSENFGFLDLRGITSRFIEINGDNHSFINTGNIHEIVSKKELKFTSSTFIDHDPIFIDGNTDFINQSITEGWSGNGMESNPIIISGFQITSSDFLVEILNTDLCFQIRDSFFVNGITGISLRNVSSGYIVNNTIHNSIGGNNERWGILLTESNNNTIFNNTFYNIEFPFIINGNNNIISSNDYFDNVNGIWIYGNNNEITNNSVQDAGGGPGIYVENSLNNSVTNNFIFNNFEGITNYYSDYNVITNNTVHGCNGLGIYIESSIHAVISNNTVYENGVDCGINIRGSSECIIRNNTVFKTPGDGIRIELGDGTSDSNVIERNTIYNNTMNGIHLDGLNNILTGNNIFDNDGRGINLGTSANYNNISSNNLADNYYYGLDCSFTSYNTISWNNFIGNGEGNYPPNSPQALNEGSLIEGSMNVFAFNYWSEWTNPDIDVDNIVDNPYHMDGGGQDSYPLTSQYPTALVDILTEPTVVVPNGGEIYTWTEGIQWLPVIDSLGHKVVYSINISADNGDTWETLVSGLNTTNYSWNTVSVADGSTYLIKVVAICSEGLIAEDISDDIISIHNTLSTPTIIFPNGGETLNGTISVQWSASNDGLGHDVTYTVFYSTNNGNTWNLLGSGLTTTQYSWDTSTITEGTSLTIHVVATCSEELTAEDVSDGTFSIHYITQVSVLSPNGGEILNETITIQWSASTDSLGHNVTYTLYYSSDNGSSWDPIASRLTTTRYDWNTTSLPDGTTYLIKVVATSSGGLTTEDISDQTFSVKNIIPPSDSFIPDLLSIVLFLLLLISGIIIILSFGFFAWRYSTKKKPTPAPDTQLARIIEPLIQEEPLMIEPAVKESLEIEPTVHIKTPIKEPVILVEPLKPEPPIKEPTKIKPVVREEPSEIEPTLPPKLLKLEPKVPEKPLVEEPAEPVITADLQPVKKAIEIPPPIKPVDDDEKLFSSIQYRVKDVIFKKADTGLNAQLVPYSGSIKEILVKLDQNQIIMSGCLKKPEISEKLFIELKIDGDPRESIWDNPWKDITLKGEDKIIRGIKLRTEIANGLNSLGTALIKAESKIIGELYIELSCIKTTEAIKHAFTLVRELQSYFDISFY
ncbi:MAG: right-handed parallel beta-helix repeat-containing protein [Candidatus Heimdallarchaeota archaeon]|nr:MAG: right-handed parallel beta-helix repeat-containing protein [Candidatus Heimdallarchaeota archaeon]